MFANFTREISLVQFPISSSALQVLSFVQLKTLAAWPLGTSLNFLLVLPWGISHPAPVCNFHYHHIVTRLSLVSPEWTDCLTDWFLHTFILHPFFYMPPFCREQDRIPAFRNFNIKWTKWVSQQTFQVSAKQN